MGFSVQLIHLIPSCTARPSITFIRPTVVFSVVPFCTVILTLLFVIIIVIVVLLSVPIARKVSAVVYVRSCRIKVQPYLVRSREVDPLEANR